MFTVETFLNDKLIVMSGGEIINHLSLYLLLKDYFLFLFRTLINRRRKDAIRICRFVLDYDLEIAKKQFYLLLLRFRPLIFIIKQSSKLII